MEIKFLKMKKKFKKGGSGIKPDLYWKYILMITFFLILCSFVFGFYLFLKTDKNFDVLTTSVDNQEIVRKKKLNESLEYFSEREKKSKEILNSPSPIVDPSI